MKRSLLASLLVVGNMIASGCTHHTVVYRVEPASVENDNSDAGSGSSPALTLPGTPVRARDGGPPQNFDAQAL